MPDLESRVAVLEQIAKDTRTDLGVIKADVKDLLKWKNGMGGALGVLKGWIAPIVVGVAIGLITSRLG